MSAEEIKEIRRALGITSLELAMRLNVSHNTVRRWECGLRQARGAAVALLRSMQKRSQRHQAKEPVPA